MAISFLSAAETLPSAVLDSAAMEDRIRAESGIRLPRGIVERITGIRSRRIAADDEYASTLAVRAGRLALARAELTPSDVDLVIFASATRDFIEPATAHVVAHELGISGQVFDVTNACNSFINGLEVARSLLLTGGYRHALIVTGETPTRSIRWRVESMQQFTTHFAGFTFGDAGAAVVLGHRDAVGLSQPRTTSRSEHWEVGGIFGGGARHPFDLDALYFTGAGSELRLAFELTGPGVIDSLLQHEGLAMDDFAHVFVHQVTVPYAERFCEVTGVDPRQLVWTVPELGNVASASLPIQLARTWDKVQPGERCLFVGLGGGISISALVWGR